ncbi:MAG: DUF2141 domain-containing protein [Thauera phenolivorans]|uniref:DUF2141 domain-containing protein n=1 Tax=Thauera phenolivorans TaxID=1792543 RepID=A0A7X7R799_9RHOO|nr:DUF2141 domain-containing protein [Thauera phenolivorans]NLF53547.1 DUF2141 domain-containing protein [Thauera phenolivorans]
MKSHLLAFLLSATASTAAMADELRLDLTLSGVQHDRGSVRVGLYADSKTFRKEAHALAVQEVPAAAGEVRVSFTGLPPGRYAIMAYHDEDGNGELNRRLGMFPTEGYGLSNNPTVIGPPTFDDSAFELAPGSGATALGIDIRY